jgi:DNA-directed RNA polymerase specialized sigma24 family protein
LLPKDLFLVKREYGLPMEGAASFHTTHWTIVMTAAQSQAQGGQEALAELCRLYWYPLYVFARRRGCSPEDAQDLTQGFFLHLLENRALGGVDRLKGKFRSFLLASFKNHISDAYDRSRRLREEETWDLSDLMQPTPKNATNANRSSFRQPGKSSMPAGP